MKMLNQDWAMFEEQALNFRLEIPDDDYRKQIEEDEISMRASFITKMSYLEKK